MNTLEYLHVSKINDGALEAPQKWLVESIWLNEAVGVVCGTPKSCKSWFCLEMAVSISSGTPVFKKFNVANKSKVLIYLAEDNLADVKERIDGICSSKEITANDIDLFVINSSSFRLDLEQDKKSFANILEDLQPKFVVLDPLVRLHRLDENNAQEMSGLLSSLRDIQRKFNTAIALVHHATKRGHSQVGLNIRGSGDLYAFGDSNICLAKQSEKINVNVEHRSAPAVAPFSVALCSEPKAHLAIKKDVLKEEFSSLEDNVLNLLQSTNNSLTRQSIRDHLKINNERLGAALLVLEKKDIIKRTKDGWIVN
jgi:hypothetical protein